MPYVTLGKSSINFVEFYIFDENSKQCGSLFYFCSINGDYFKRSGKLPKEIDEDIKNIENLANAILLANLKEKERDSELKWTPYRSL